MSAIYDILPMLKPSRYHQLLKLLPAGYDRSIIRGFCIKQGGDFQQAEFVKKAVLADRMYARVLNSQAPSDPDKIERAKTCIYNSCQTNEPLIDILDDALASTIYRDKFDGYYEMGLCYRDGTYGALKNYKTAMRAFTMSKQQGNVNAVVELAGCMIKTGNQIGAIAEYQSIMTSLWDYPPALASCESIILDEDTRSTVLRLKIVQTNICFGDLHVAFSNKSTANKWRHSMFALMHYSAASTDTVYPIIEYLVKIVLYGKEFTNLIEEKGKLLWHYGMHLFRKCKSN